MKNVPFNVSARTARLIGRENVSSAEGAIIELVKNSYDADAKFCIVFFDDRLVELPDTISAAEYEWFRNSLEKLNLSEILHCYSPDMFSEIYTFSRKLYEKSFSAQQRTELEKRLSANGVVYILDDGEGMSEEIIERAWMTIGTDNKNIKFLSDTGRVKSGAKGIGRFALDRLGEQCELHTKTENSDKTLFWKVDWSDFDRQGLTIDGVSAKLGFTDNTLAENLKSAIGRKLSELHCVEKVTKGSQIRISGTRDYWKKENIDKIYSELASLIPPAEAGGFNVYVYSRRHPGEFGQILPSICEDYDYKLSASMDEAGLVTIETTKKELDEERLTNEILNRPLFKKTAYTRSKLLGETFKYSKTLYQLIPGLKEKNDKAHESIGKFSFSLYFLKRLSDRKDIDMYLHRHYDSESRKRWLEHNNGVRIYRDNFRVRPYGEIGKASWDWLGLGRRQAADPSALRTGRWRVPPNNMAGIINISRVNNLGLEDKSSREGLQENDTFSLFKSVIESIVKEFESDRSALYRELFLIHQEKKNIPTDDELNPAEEEDAEKIAQKIFDNLKKENVEHKDDSEKLALALLKEKARTREIDDRLEDMRKENSLLRVFASSGITIASFTHELDNLNSKLGSRFDPLGKMIRDYAAMDDSARQNIENFKSPFIRIEMLRRDDERVKNWIKYSLRTIRKDKRKRVKINIKTYLENLRDEWASTLLERQISIKIEVDDSSTALRAYEIDLDCIFNNLIINSADAFKRPGFAGVRKITIGSHASNGKIKFNYRDTGPGLSSDIQEPQNIFQPTFTTKKNSLGEEIGTGLGMWLVQKTLDEYRGVAQLENGSGFGLTMELEG
ncbi:MULTISPECIES: sensor histidine kinase [unclassified Pseudomonas]|uniref:sensor histidine kinase n=1 Tax=unclassified Pseudomonas TaxID=196821 RepID=UPI000BD06DCB|nr:MULTISPECIES: sensor histidine kinase [unclassified Pseudomonas]PVZ12617.1 histidine kinase/DNA gyrase B/HSP90-like ATPase [Pseudomonas sp. URIL14HWK12:I12]PVZ23232.1 histidine kinase/DNA gyrase B/HSP90-like ATPase [Pseudomonas sp. URIL14HWK12:I10]PVZ32561.1 histidine kinase/DNA gyrase B/HSP90-like ATPase [Pseudomonas sp. URIL14HWK12:I11]SNZ13670.1 Histidine kinase-, DNA gyrase B-, and HSP90-like ATPase [Pseudomonas sp. URIL14HWK12:I9]